MVPTILQIIPELNVGGAEKTVLEMTEALAKLGWRSLVVAEGGGMVEEVEAAGAVFISLPVASKNPVVLLLNALRLKRLIEREAVDVVHARSRAPGWSALLACRMAGVPFLTTYHGAHSQKTALKRFYNSVMARGDVVIANSEYTARQINRHHASCVKRLVTINRGVDLLKTDLAAVSPERKQLLLDHWGIDQGKRVVLMPARLSKRKGQLDVIEAVSQLKRSGEAGLFKVILAGGIEGSEDYYKELQDAIAKAGLQGVVECVGYCSDMPAAFAVSDLVLAVSSKPESFGRVVAESLAMKLPILVTDVGAQGELIRDETGCLGIGARAVAPGQPAALARGISELLQLSPEELELYGAAARAHIEENYSICRLKHQTIEVYKSLLRTKSNTDLL